MKNVWASLHRISLALLFTLFLTEGNAQHMVFITQNGLPSGNVFSYNKEMVEESSILHLEFDFEKMTVKRYLRHIDFVIHSITWTECKKLSDFHYMWRIKTREGWVFEIGFVNRRMAYMIQTDRYTKVTKYLPYDHQDIKFQIPQ